MCRLIGATVLLAALAGASAAMAAPKPAAFAVCGGCHEVDPDAGSGVGPNLFGVGGRKAGAGDFEYSPAMKGASFDWTRQNLIDFVKNPRGKVPGNAMMAAPVENGADAAAIADYLLSLK